MAKESPKPPKGDKKTKEEKKEEKRRRKDMKKSKDSLLESEPGTPRRKDTSPGRDSQVIVHSIAPGLSDCVYCHPLAAPAALNFTPGMCT